MTSAATISFRARINTKSRRGAVHRTGGELKWKEMDFDYEYEAGSGLDKKLCFKKKAILLSSSYFGALDHSK